MSRSIASRAIIKALSASSSEDKKGLTKQEICSYIAINIEDPIIDIHFDPVTKEPYMPQFNYEMGRLITSRIVDRWGNRYRLRGF